MPALDVARMLQSPKRQGFAFFAPIQQSDHSNSYMFYNVQEVLVYQGNNVQIEYRVSRRDDQAHTQWSLLREADSESLITDQFWNKMVDSLCGYTANLPVSDEYANGIIVADVDSETGFSEVLVVPDPTLPAGERYGVQYRPRQNMFRNIYAARKVFVQAANSLLAYNPIRDDNPSWNTSVETDAFWKYTTWYAPGYEDVTPNVVFQLLAEAALALALGNLKKGDIVRVTQGTTDGRFKMYAVIQPDPNVNALSLQEVAVEASAIKLLDTVYTARNIYALAVELRQLLTAFRDQVMIDNFFVDQNRLFFSMLNFVVSEQKDIDWAFKTSYIYIKENNLPLLQSRFYTPDQTENVIKYITEAKPYHTKIRDYTSTYALLDIADGTATDTHKFEIELKFGPAENPQLYLEGNVDGLYGWDLNQGEYQLPWEDVDVLPPELSINGSQELDNEQWDSEQTINSYVNQYASGNPVLPMFDPAGGDWPDNISVDLTSANFDAVKAGYSTLYPYTFDILSLDDPQSVIIPESMISVIVDEVPLIYGRDYFVQYNNNTVNYTVFFFENIDVSAAAVKVIVWINGGTVSRVRYNGYRDETARGFAFDNFTIDVNVRLPVNTVDGDLTPYVGYGEVWDSLPTGTALAGEILAAGGTLDIPWDQILESNPVLLDSTISYKENRSPAKEVFYGRNALAFAGQLFEDLLAPTATTDNVQDIIVIVDAVTHPAGLDILPTPAGAPVVIWINGERIEYLQKVQLDTNIWKLSLVARGTWKTAPTNHYAGDYVWVQMDNTVPDGSPYTADEKVWNVLVNSDQTVSRAPGEYTNVDAQIPAGGMWYSYTDQSEFLKESAAPPSP